MISRDSSPRLTVVASRPADWPAHDRPPLFGGPQLAFDTILEGIQFSGRGDDQGLSFPLLNPDDTLRRRPVHLVTGAQDRTDLAGAYALLYALFGGKGQISPHRIHSGLPWNFERYPLPQGSQLRFFHRPFGTRITVSPWKRDNLQVILERGTPFAGVKRWVGYDPTGVVPVVYRDSFFVQLKHERPNAGVSSFEEAARQLQETSFSGISVSQSYAFGFPVTNQVTLPGKQAPEGLAVAVEDNDFATLSIRFLPASHLIRGAFFYAPGFSQEGLNAGLRRLWDDALLAAQHQKPPFPLTYGDPKNLLRRMTGIQTALTEEVFEDMLAKPDDFSLEEWEGVGDRIDLQRIENPALFKGYEINGRDILLSSGRRHVVFSPNRAPRGPLR